MEVFPNSNLAFVVADFNIDKFDFVVDCFYKKSAKAL